MQEFNGYTVAEIFDAGVEQEHERIIAVIEEFAENTDYPEVEDTLFRLMDVLKGGKGEQGTRH